MRRDIPIVVALAATALAVCACSPASSPAAAIATAPAASSSAPAAAAPAATLGPLTLGAFPGTTDGRLAKDTCEQWQGLRGQYAARLAADTPYQLNQWFSGPDWHAAWTDVNKLGDDPAYGNLETAFGVALVGDMASIPDARLIDKACAAG
jgi:hypothetical protein